MRGWVFQFLGLGLAVFSVLCVHTPGTGLEGIVFTSIASCVAFYLSARHFCLVIAEPALPPLRRLLWRNVDRLRIASRAGCYLTLVLIAPTVGALRPGSYWLAISASLGLMISGLLEGAFRVLGKRLAASSARARVQEDGRRPVVYLRAFDDDGMVIPGSASEGALISRTMTRRLEAMLSEWFERVGPFVALGRPGERLPLDGAARDYAGDDWKEQVDAFLERAQSIVLMISSTAGVEWEVQRIAGNPQHLTKTVWLLPNVRSAQLLARWHTCAAQLEAAAPHLQLPAADLIERSCFVYFDASGQCHGVGKRRAFLTPYPRALDSLLERGVIRSSPRQADAVQTLERPAAASGATAEPPGFAPVQAGWASFVGGASAATLMYAIDELRRGRRAAASLALPVAGLTLDWVSIGVHPALWLPVTMVLGLLGYAGFEARNLLLVRKLSQAPVWQAVCLAALLFFGKLFLFNLLAGAPDAQASMP